MLYLSHTQLMKAAEKYQCVVWETLRCLDQHFIGHVINHYYESYKLAKNLEKVKDTLKNKMQKIALFAHSKTLLKYLTTEIFLN